MPAPDPQLAFWPAPKPPQFQLYSVTVTLDQWGKVITLDEHEQLVFPFYWEVWRDIYEGDDYD